MGQTGELLLHNAKKFSFQSTNAIAAASAYRPVSRMHSMSGTV